MKSKQVFLNEKDIAELEAILIELPFKFAQPLIQFLSSKVKTDAVQEPSVSDSTGNNPE